ncbi:SET domain containing protein [Novymonas esmeraldas]|uniref:SET domain containing protein n=1 Tax=Novymonas esmeraldas TaxID=1808958 RepID=A0AAW0ESM7_9TRYP
MLHRSCVVRCFGKTLYGASSTLPSDFLHCCSSHFGIHLHEETFIGTRSSQQRGLFLAHTRAAPLPANTPIATVPLSTLYSVSNISTKADALPHVTLEMVRNAIADEEFRMMAPQFYLGLQMGAIIAAVPDITRASTTAEVQSVTELLRSGAAPYARMLDDEDFNEEFVFGMYGMALDSWQRTSYEEMTKKYHIALTSIHEAANPPFKLEHLQRITRLVLARAEHLPPADFYTGSPLLRRLRRRWRRLRKTPDPAEVTLVPLLDLVNHSNRPNCAIRVGPSPVLDGAGAVTLFTLRDVQPGQELCRHYNFALNRAVALFRYGFLPFDLISIVDHDAIDEHVMKSRDMFRPESEARQSAHAQEAAEVARMERLFQKAKHSHAPCGRVAHRRH